MEEDIKILEDFIKYYEAEAISRKFRGTLSISVDENDIEAIENLINRNKELEKLELEHQKINGNLREKIKELEKNKELKTIKGFEENIEVSKFGEWVGKNYIDYKFEYENYQKILADYIPKSKIKEKIEELERDIEDYLKTDNSGRFTRENCRMTDEVNILKELLEE